MKLLCYLKLQKCYDLYRPTSINWVVKSRRLRWAAYVAHIRNMYIILVGKVVTWKRKKDATWMEAPLDCILCGLWYYQCVFFFKYENFIYNKNSVSRKFRYSFRIPEKNAFWKQG